MKVIRIDDFNDFEELYNKYYDQTTRGKDDLKNLIVLFTGNDDPETKQSWCPDCVLCKPVIEKVLEGFKHNEQIALVVVRVGDRPIWKTPENPYRLHKLAISCIPTVVSLSNVSISTIR